MRLPRLFIVLLIITIAFGTMYSLVQQLDRMSANAQPTQLAEDAAAKLDAGLSPGYAFTSTVDMAHSVAPFIIIYDKSGKVVTGSGYLDGKIPRVDTAVLKDAQPGKDNQVTWQPKAGVRIASVEVAAKKYYVLGGQSLRLTESRANKLLAITALGWAISVIFILIDYFVLQKLTTHLL